MGQMAAGRQIEAHEGVAGLHQRDEDRRIGRRAGMRLDVCETQPNNLVTRSIARRLRDIHELASAVVAPARHSLRHTCW